MYSNYITGLRLPETAVEDTEGRLPGKVSLEGRVFRNDGSGEVNSMKRIDSILKDPVYAEYINHNMSAAKDDLFCKHDLAHSVDVARIAYILILENQDLDFFIKDAGLSGKEAAKEVVYAAGLLHDIGKWKEYEEGVDHAAYGARLARDLLTRAGFDENEIRIITRAIYEHRNISRDMSFLGERLHRADNLSRACSQCVAREDCCKYQNKETGAFLLY